MPPGAVARRGRAGSVKSLGEIGGARAGCAPAWIRHCKWKWDCIFLSIVDLFAEVTQFFRLGVYRVL